MSVRAAGSAEEPAVIGFRALSPPSADLRREADDRNFKSCCGDVDGLVEE